MALLTPFPGFTYHPHQVEGIEWMMDRETDGRYCYGGILADEMGLGKTWETVGLLLNRPVPVSMILVPPVLQSQWSEVLCQSNIPHKILGSSAKHPWRSIAGGRDILVLLATYDRATRHIEHIRDEWKIDRILCDEGHVFRNGPSTKRFQELSELKCEYRWLLTGTPVQNRKKDFDNLLRWLDGCWDPKEDCPSYIADTIMLRRTVADVREAVPAFPTSKPVHYVHPTIMEADSEEKKVFDRLVKRFQTAVDCHMQQWLILELYLRIRQFLAHPQIYKNAMMKKHPKLYEGEDPLWKGTASKLEGFSNYLQAAEKKPTLVFTTFCDEMDFAEQALRKAGYRTWRICGGLGENGVQNTVVKSREAAAEGNDVAVLVQIQAGNAGINLQHLPRIVFLSSHWNPSMVDQAVGRAYRIGQTQTVEVHHFLLADGAEKNLDRHMASLHSKKRAIARTLNSKLKCESAIEARVVFEKLNAVCPDEVDRGFEEAEEAE
jgi:SNF2 family DNA or RNA helicase